MEEDGSRYISLHEVATLYDVTAKTVMEWARRGLIPVILTPTGRRRYPRAAVMAEYDRVNGGKK